MFVSFALLEALEEDGRGESFLIFPSEGPSVPADRIRDIRGFPNAQEVELGPLRFYTDSAGLKFRRITFQYGSQAMSRTGDWLEVHIEHRGLPIADNTVGYYSVLLPEGYFGQALVVYPSMQHHNETWLDDLSRMLVTVELHAGNEPSIVLDARLQQNAAPPPGFLSPGFERVHSRNAYREWSKPISYSSVSGFIRAANASLSGAAPAVFLCHSSSDNGFARRLAVGLAGSGCRVWFDEAEIRVGDSLLAKMEHGILGAKYLIACLSRASVQSRWCQEELRMALARQIGGHEVTVLPVLLESCGMPGFLQEKKYADFSKPGPYEFEKALAELRGAIG